MLSRCQCVVALWAWCYDKGAAPLVPRCGPCSAFKGLKMSLLLRKHTCRLPSLAPLCAPPPKVSSLLPLLPGTFHPRLSAACQCHCMFGCAAIPEQIVEIFACLVTAVWCSEDTDSDKPLKVERSRLVPLTIRTAQLHPCCYCLPCHWQWLVPVHDSACSA